MFKLDSKELNLVSEAITQDILSLDLANRFCLSCNDQCKKGMK